MRRLGTALRLIGFIWGSVAVFRMALAAMAQQGHEFGYGLFALALGYGVFAWGTSIRQKATGQRT